MHRSSSLVSLLFLFTIVSASFERSFYANRSADIIIVPENIQDDSFVLIFDSTNTEKSSSDSSIDETQLANLISAFVGGPIVNSEASLDEHIVAGHSLFNKAKANLVVIVDGVGADDLKTDLKIKQKTQNIKLNKVAYPQDSVASISTIITGHSPSVHGIVNENWRNSKEDEFVAFHNNAGPAIFNVHDQLSQTFDGIPLIISGSGRFELSGAGVNRFSQFGNNYNMFYNPETRSFVNANGKSSNGLNISRSSISNADELNWKDFNFEMELKFIENLIARLASKEFEPLVKDNIPDLYSYTFASLRNLKSQSNFDESIQRLDAALVQLVERLSGLYAQKITVEIVFLGTSAQERLAANAELKKTVQKAISSLSMTSTLQYFPSIYLAERENQKIVCEKLKTVISNEVFCPEEPTRFHNYESFEANGTVTVNENATVFQTVLWISLLMIFFLIGAIYAVTTISTEVATDPWLQVREETKEHLL